MTTNQVAKNHELKLSPETMRSLGYRVVDMLVEHFEGLPSQSAVPPKGEPTVLRTLLDEPLPQMGTDINHLLDQVVQDIFGYIGHVDHPRFFAFVPSPNNFVSVMADALVAGFTPFAGTWLEASGPAQIELTTVDWLRQTCGLPAEAGGLFVSGGSMANITGLAVARHVKLNDRLEGATVYFSDQTHSSVERGLRLLGFQPEQLCKLEADDAFRLDLAVLKTAINADRGQGRRPFCIVANAGATNTGAIDPLPELADYCRQEGLWLHVDGAYGAAAALSERGKTLLAGLEQADSLSLDPHKWLFQPYEIACVIVKNRQWLKDTFHILPEYMVDVAGQGEEINFCDYGIQLTRSFRALKLWLSLKYFGQAAFAGAIARGFELADYAETVLREMPDWQIVTPAQMAVINFRYAPQGVDPTEFNHLNKALVEKMLVDGLAMVVSTTLKGQTVLRFCTINPRTTEADIRQTLEKFDALGQDLLQK